MRAAVVALAALLVACSGGRPALTAAPGPSAAPATTPCGSAAAAPAQYRHVIWIWMENHSYRQVLGSRAAPYETGLAADCATATDYRSVGSPSLPNYLGATSGGTWGVADDAAPGSHPLARDNLFRQVRASGRAERSFEEGMPRPCAVASNGRYAVKHNPAAYYVGAGDRAACSADDLPLDPGLAAAIKDGGLPAFTFVTPDLCHDTHDCSVVSGDAWLAEWIPRIVAGPDYRDGSTAVFVVWDEDAPMPLIVISPSVRPGSVAAERLDHYALLHTTEELLGLPYLGAAAGAPSMRVATGL